MGFAAAEDEHVCIGKLASTFTKNMRCNFINIYAAFTKWKNVSWNMIYSTLFGSQKQSRSGLCSNLPDMRSFGDKALNPSLRKSKRE